MAATHSTTRSNTFLIGYSLSRIVVSKIDEGTRNVSNRDFQVAENLPTVGKKERSATG